MIFKEIVIKGQTIFNASKKDAVEFFGASSEEIEVAEKVYLKAQKQQAIETHIYSKYPQKTQAQDQIWTDNFRTKLVAMGVTDVELKVVGGVKTFMGGTPIAEYLKDEPAETVALFTKLIKIAIRSEWAFGCIVEGKKAISENRDPVYAEFPDV